MKRTFIFYIICLLSIFYSAYSKEEMLHYDRLAKHPTEELFNKGNSYLKQNYIDTAMGYYIIVAGQYHKSMDKADKYLCVKASIQVGHIYFQKGHYTEAFDFLMTALKNCEENDFSNLLPEIYNNIGSVYCAWKDYSQGLECYKKGFQYSETINNDSLRKKLLINMVGAYCFMDNIAEARKYYNIMMQYQHKDPVILYFCLLNKGLILQKEGNIQVAALSFRKAAEYAKQKRMEPSYICSSYSCLSDLYQKEGQNDSVLYYLHKGLEVSGASVYMQRELLRGLANIYKKQKNNINAIYYTNKYLLLSDSLFDQNEFNRIKNTQFVYEMDKNYRKISSLNAEKELSAQQIKRQKNALVFISISLLVFMAMIVLLYLQKKKLNMAYKDLFFRNNEIMESDRQNREQRADFEQKLMETKIMLARYIGQDIKPDEEQTNYDETEDVKQYSVDKLTKEQKDKILLAIDKIMEIPQEYCDCDFSVERLSDLIGFNSCYVSRVINDTYQKNFRSFINEFRIKEARRRLMNTKEYGNYTIKAIAESVGYKSHANFVLIFRKLTGITPSIYQKMARERGGKEMDV